MSPAVIEVVGLRKEYRRLRGEPTVALSGVDLVVPEGGVFGFLGPNGSGKTTTIRCVLGLIRPTAGEVRLLGQSVGGGSRPRLDRVGAIVESPKFHPGLSGRRNLALLAGLAGLPNSRVEAVLDRVGMSERAQDRFGTYSLGMKQRLAVAGALLKDPELLVLDEPANGLDPAGIVEMRALIRSVADEGRTVVVSSHQLSEIEQVCDHIGILARGRCLVAGSVDEVIAASGVRGRSVVVGIEDPAAAGAVLGAAGYSAGVGPEGLVVAAGPNGTVPDPSEVNRLLGAAGQWLFSLRVERASLEDVFLRITAGVRPGEEGR